ncbi:hypothetical protein JW835_16735 [bacterium]|nr:hypothetical protein [bacterium]
MADTKTRYLFGIILIVVGVIFLLVNFSDVSMSHLWPFFPLTVGIGLVLGYFQNRDNLGFLMPGVVLITISLLFFYCAISGWHHMSQLWPVFIWAPAGGFIAMYFGGSRDRGLLMPAGILGLIGFIFIAVNYRISNFLPVVMIAVGAFLVLSQIFSGKKGESEG